MSNIIKEKMAGKYPDPMKALPLTRKMYFSDYDKGKIYQVGNTTIKFTTPLFHRIEYARVGWIFGTPIRYQNESFFHSSDMNGPIIEDYARMIIKIKPDILILNGSMIYMFGYLLNRAIRNCCEIIKMVHTRIIIYKHHLPREKRFRPRPEPIWKEAVKYNKSLLTVAEFIDRIPVVLEEK